MTTNRLVNIYFTKFFTQLPSDLWSHYINLLPKALRDKNEKYTRWKDRHSHLFGKLLLLEALKEYGYGNILKELEYNQHGRPFIKGKVDFNISHSSNYVLCALSESGRVGVDIEKINRIDFDDFAGVMSSNDWEQIKTSSEPLKSFFKFWTIKESVIKADSRGLAIPLTDVQIKNDMAHCGNSIWHLKTLAIDKDYSAYLATKYEETTVALKEIDFYKKVIISS